MPASSHASGAVYGASPLLRQRATRSTALISVAGSLQRTIHAVVYGLQTIGDGLGNFQDRVALLNRASEYLSKKNVKKMQTRSICEQRINSSADSFTNSESRPGSSSNPFRKVPGGIWYGSGGF